MTVDSGRLADQKLSLCHWGKPVSCSPKNEELCEIQAADKTEKHALNVRVWFKLSRTNILSIQALQLSSLCLGGAGGTAGMLQSPRSSWWQPTLHSSMAPNNMWIPCGSKSLRADRQAGQNRSCNASFSRCYRWEQENQYDWGSSLEGKFSFTCTLPCLLGSCQNSSLLLQAPVPWSHLALSWPSCLTHLVLHIPLSPLLSHIALLFCTDQNYRKKPKLCGLIFFPLTLVFEIFRPESASM